MEMYLENHSSCGTNTKWTEFKNALNILIAKYIPTKMCNQKMDTPGSLAA